VYVNKINIFLDEKGPCMFYLFISLLRIPDVVVDKQPHRFQKFINITLCKSKVLSIIHTYLTELGGYLNENICVSLVETVVENIRVRLRNDFFYGKRAVVEINENLRIYLEWLILILVKLFTSEFKSKKLDLFIQSQLSGGDVLLKELIKNFSSPSSLLSFLISSTIRLFPEMVPFSICFSILCVVTVYFFLKIFFCYFELGFFGFTI
jgi:hypothetical protein